MRGSQHGADTADSLKCRVYSESLVFKSQIQAVHHFGHGSRLANRHFVISVNPAIVVLVFVFHVTRTYRRERLNRTLTDIFLIAEVADSLKTKCLSYLMTFRIQIVIRLITLTVFQHFAVHERNITVDIVTEITDFIIPAKAQFESFAFHLTYILLRNVDTDHS